MNKNKFLIKILVGFLFVSAITSCEDYLDVNTDPNNPTVVTPDLILPVGQHYTAGYMHGDRRLSHLGNMLMYNWSESNGFSWYDTEFQYNVTTTFYSALFDNAYSQALKQYHLLTENDDPLYVNYAAIGEIMKAYHYQILVDLYGDVPYSEALGRSTNATPIYDSGEAIYADLLVKLNAAIDMIKNAGEEAVLPEADDAMFGGDMTEWIKFANTLKVRIVTRWSDVNPGAAATELATIAAEGTGFITTDVLINPGYLDEEGKQNPFWAAFGAGPDGTNTLTNNATAATQYIIDLLQDTNDPRIDYLYEEPATGHLGIDQGLEPGTDYAPEFVSNIGPGLLIDATQGSPIFTLAEHNFNMAELSLKAGNDAEAEAFYYAGIEASFDFLGAPLGSYLAANQTTENVGWDASPNKLEAIITQKWLAVNGATAEQSWFDYTRTGFPENLPLSAQAIHPTRPVRLFYPSSETSTNALNVPAQPDAFTTRIFWAN
jgi:hypothetical protein